MEQIKELLEILKSTPEMGLWALAIWCMFILLKMASWIYALKVVIIYIAKRYFDYKDKKEDTALKLKEFQSNSSIDLLIDKSSYNSDGECTEAMRRLLIAISDRGGSVFKSDIDRSIKILLDNKKFK